MFGPLKDLLDQDPRVAYALVFGSSARGTASSQSDIDVAIGLMPELRLTVREIGDLVSRLEEAAGIPVDLVFVEEAPPALSFRIFRDGMTLSVRDRGAFVKAKARAIIDYLDFKPIEDICIQGVLKAASRGR